MALTDNGNGLSAADVAAVMGGNGGYNGFGNDGMFWLLILFLFAWTGNGWGGYGNGSNGTTVVANDVQRGFDQQAIMTGLGTLNSAVASAEVSRSNMQANLTQSINDIAMGLQNCCCENRAATADLKYTMATEGSATRSAIQQGVQDIVVNQTSSTQAVLDKLCQLELDGMKQRNADLLAENNALKFASSQTEQTAAILANNAAQTQALEQYLNPAPIPAYVVQNPSCCNGGYACGCNA